MKTYSVKITETLEMIVTVEAETVSEAEALVSEEWHKGEYILDADCFTGVDFTAEEVK